jgi:hypothetical protein
MRQTGGSYNHVGGDLVMGENAQPSRPQIGRGDKDLRALGFPHRLKIDEALDQVFQGIDV